MAPQDPPALNLKTCPTKRQQQQHLRQLFCPLPRYPFNTLGNQRKPFVFVINSLIRQREPFPFTSPSLFPCHPFRLVASLLHCSYPRPIESSLKLTTNKKAALHKKRTIQKTTKTTSVFCPLPCPLFDVDYPACCIYEYVVPFPSLRFPLF